jgi:DtxR family Mn-dependent transcriptional regulator
LLGDPLVDPHGHPIPTKELKLPSSPGRPLWDVIDGSAAQVDRVSDDVSEALRYLAELGIRPGVTVEVVGRGPMGGPLFVKVEGGAGDPHALSKELAEAVWVA